MQYTTERTVAAFADPIPWMRQADIPVYERWHANLGWVQYHITNYQEPDTGIDRLRSPCPWRLFVQCVDKSNTGVVWSASLEEAQRFARHHFRTRDLAEITSVHAAEAAAYAAALKTFEKKWRTARTSIVEKFLAHKTPYLTADTTDRMAPEFRMSGRRGNYHARFDPIRRWVVTYTRPDQTTEERCFLARTFVEMGCAYHSQRGEWRGTLKANQSPLSQYLTDYRVTTPTTQLEPGRGVRGKP